MPQKMRRPAGSANQTLYEREDATEIHEKVLKEKGLLLLQALLDGFDPNVDPESFTWSDISMLGFKGEHLEYLLRTGLVESIDGDGSSPFEVTLGGKGVYETLVCPDDIDAMQRYVMDSLFSRE